MIGAVCCPKDHMGLCKCLKGNSILTLVISDPTDRLSICGVGVSQCLGQDLSRNQVIRGCPSLNNINQVVEHPKAVASDTLEECRRG